MKSISELQEELDVISLKILDGPRPNGLFLIPESPTHTGAAHAEIVNGEYHYVVTERGSEFERKIAQDEDELLYWFTSDSLSSIASGWELEHRNENEDSRRQLFAKRIELFNKINPKWAARKQAYHEKVLKEHPYTS